MKPKQEQIEEMAKVVQDIMYYTPDEEDNRYRYLTHLDKQSSKEISENLYAAGYRKASDVIDEFMERVKERALQTCRKIINCYEVTTAREIRDKIESKGRFEFCGYDGKEYLTISVDKFNQIINQYMNMDGNKE